MKKAIVLGATGMVGTQLIHLLIENDAYTEIVSLIRRPSGINHPKLKEQIIDFNKLDAWSNLVTGDVLFSAMGTTIGKAKTKENQYKVDFTYQYSVAEIAAKNGVTSFVLVSSAGANSASKMFYLSMKGKLENAIQMLPFEIICIIRPGILDGKRIKNRFDEKVLVFVMYTLNKLGLFKRYRPILAKEVAIAMIHAVDKKKSAVYTLDEVFKLAE